MFYAILIPVLVFVDQIVKYLVRAHIPLGENLPFLPHILDLTYAQNTGAAFSLLSEHTWLLTALSAIVSIMLIVVLLRKVFSHPLSVFSLSLVLSGAIGNLIDRVLFGYVTDMFEVLFMEFAVFNIADSCIVVGAVLLCVAVLFFPENALMEKEKK